MIINNYYNELLIPFMEIYLNLDNRFILLTLKIYQEHCIEEKQMERYMNVNIKDYKLQSKRIIYS